MVHLPDRTGHPTIRRASPRANPYRFFTRNLRPTLVTRIYHALYYDHFYFPEHRLRPETFRVESAAGIYYFARITDEERWQAQSRGN